MLQGRCGLAVGAETTPSAAKVRGPASEIDHEKVRITRVSGSSSARAITLVSLARKSGARETLSSRAGSKKKKKEINGKVEQRNKTGEKRLTKKAESLDQE